MGNFYTKNSSIKLGPDFSLNSVGKARENMNKVMGIKNPAENYPE